MLTRQNQEDFSLAALSDMIRDPGFRARFTGLSDASAAHVVAGLFRPRPRSICLVVPGVREAERMAGDLRFFLGDPDAPVDVFPSYHAGAYKSLAFHNETSARRVRHLYGLMTGDAPRITVTTAEAFIRRLIPREVLAGAAELVMAGEETDLDALTLTLVSGGYTRTALVEEPGDFCPRGGILDVFSPLYPDPLRLEFFGDMVESIRFFSPATQRTLREVPEAVLPPAREALLRPSDTANFLDRVTRYAANADLPAESVRTLAERIKNEGIFPGIEHLMPFLFEKLDILNAYLPPDTLFVVAEPGACAAAAGEFLVGARAAHAQALAEGRIGAPPESLFQSWNDVESILRERPLLSLQLLPTEGEDDSGMARHHVDVSGNEDLKTALRHPADPDHPFAALDQWIRDHRDQRRLVVLACQTKARAEHLLSVLGPYGLRPEFLPAMPDTGRLKTGVVLCQSAPSAGFSLPEAGLALITDADVFGRRRTARRSAKRSPRTDLLTFEDLKIGDLVVHADHGIGRYEGLSKLSLDGVTGDFLQVSYRDADRLYLPVDRMNALQRYMGVEGVAPVLDKMGGASWAKVKAKVKKSVEAIAGELLKLYAERRVREGHACSVPEAELAKFEDGFPYEETPDQRKAIEDVLADMARPDPMDRLVCGDVGYGKTEIALRAAFAAVQDGRQVAILVPTTVLAEQHFETFSARMAEFPITVACLSRFRPAKAQRDIVGKLADGRMDIVIGTHRLLQKDVTFQRLGLIIIDEEQRFGVRHKERLKQLRSTVDVLALTATPIPRTLHMSLSGLRDISVITTPPEERRAIITYLCEPDDAIIADAIRKELRRGGQVFFVHNHIASIGRMAERIANLVPEARLDIAHGQMAEEDLEKAMVRFMSRELDVLVCTTLIESGLDVGTANTILINRADRFGLSQIYQLRGRVGRSDEQAYAYLLIPAETTLTRDAQKRLKVLMEHSDLGSGFQIAMSDLQIRGGGTLLGSSQSGHIAAVGYDMFLKLMEEAIAELKGETVTPELVPEINIPMSTYIPEDYIPDIDQRMTAYRRLARLDRLPAISDFKREMEDRFGPLSKPAEHLLLKIMLKVLAVRSGIRRLDLAGNLLVLTFSPDHQRNPFGLATLLSTRKRGLELTPDGILKVDLALTEPTLVRNPLAAAKNILKEIGQHVNE